MMMRDIKLLDAVPYLRAYHGQTFVIKIGGDLIDDATRLSNVTRDVAVLHRLGIRVVVVHGGGPQLDRLTAKLGLPVERIAGRRITSPEVLNAAKMLFRGQLSLELVSAIKRQGETAVGISGADGGLVKAERRPKVEMTSDDGEVVFVDFGEVGDVVTVDPSVLNSIFEAGSIPVVSPLAADDDGVVLNVNADTMAAEIAMALGAAKLILMTNVAGILEDASDPTTLLHWTDIDQLDQLEKAGKFTGGMRPKITSIRLALRGGIARVHVVDARRSGAVLEEVFTTDGCGTLVVQSAGATPPEPGLEGGVKASALG